MSFCILTMVQEGCAGGDIEGCFLRNAGSDARGGGGGGGGGGHSSLLCEMNHTPCPKKVISVVCGKWGGLLVFRETNPGDSHQAQTT